MLPCQPAPWVQPVLQISPARIEYIWAMRQSVHCQWNRPGHPWAGSESVKGTGQGRYLRSGQHLYRMRHNRHVQITINNNNRWSLQHYPQTFHIRISHPCSFFCGKRCDRIKVLPGNRMDMCCLWQEIIVAQDDIVGHTRNVQKPVVITWRQLDWLQTDLRTAKGACSRPAWKPSWNRRMQWHLMKTWITLSFHPGRRNSSSWFSFHRFSSYSWNCHTKNVQLSILWLLPLIIGTLGSFRNYPFSFFIDYLSSSSWWYSE